MNYREIIDSSTSEYWEKAYQSADMTWDLGEPTPVLINGSIWREIPYQYVFSVQEMDGMRLILPIKDIM